MTGHFKIKWNSFSFWSNILNILWFLNSLLCLHFFNIQWEHIINFPIIIIHNHFEIQLIVYKNWLLKINWGLFDELVRDDIYIIFWISYILHKIILQVIIFTHIIKYKIVICARQLIFILLVETSLFTINHIFVTFI